MFCSGVFGCYLKSAIKSSTVIWVSINSLITLFFSNNSFYISAPMARDIFASSLKDSV